MPRDPTLIFVLGSFGLAFAGGLFVLLAVVIVRGWQLNSARGAQRALARQRFRVALFLLASACIPMAISPWAITSEWFLSKNIPVEELLAYSLAWLPATLLLIAGIALTAWGWWWDRAKGVMRCYACAYRMQASVGLRCPECGHLHRRPEDLLRTRRKWWRVAAGIVFVTLTVGEGIIAARGSRLWVVPTGSLFWLRDHCRLHSSKWHFLNDTLKGRKVSPETLVSRAREACGWNEKALDGLIVVRRRHVLGEPCWARLDTSGRMSPWAPDFKFQLKVFDSDGNLTQLCRPGPSGWTPDHFSVAPPNPQRIASGQLVLTATWQNGEEIVVCDRPFTKGVEVVSSLEEAILPSDSTAIETSLRMLAGAGLQRSETGKIWIHWGGLLPIGGECAVAVRWVFSYDEEVVAEATYVQGADPARDGEVYSELRGDMLRMADFDPTSARWSVRAEGDQRAALRVPEARFYWAGGVSIAASTFTWER